MAVHRVFHREPVQPLATTPSPMLKWVWLKIKQEGLRRFWAMFPLTRVDFGTGLLSHNQNDRIPGPRKCSAQIAASQSSITGPANSSAASCGAGASAAARSLEGIAGCRLRRTCLHDVTQSANNPSTDQQQGFHSIAEWGGHSCCCLGNKCASGKFRRVCIEEHLVPG